MIDLDGTLVDTTMIAPAVYADTIHALGGPDVSPATVVATWHIGVMPVVLAHAAALDQDAQPRSLRRHAEMTRMAAARSRHR